MVAVAAGTLVRPVEFDALRAIDRTTDASPTQSRFDRHVVECRGVEDPEVVIPRTDHSDRVCELAEDSCPDRTHVGRIDS